MKSISEFTGLNFNEIFKLNYSMYLLYRRESWLYNMKKTEQGKEFLMNLNRLQQTNADYKAIKEISNKIKK